MWGLGLRDYASAACMLDGFVALCGAMLVGKGHVSLHDRFTYVGDLVHDGYLAMWQLANSYYEAQIYASGCGNFGSNATLPFAYDVGRCTQGVPQNSSLNGRDTVMLQKKYFGGLHLSDELYKWATTSGASLGDLFVSRQVSEDRYSSRHSLACDVDTMFHPMQGAIGVRLEEVRHVSMKNVDVRNLRNLGDQHGPTCQARWRLLSNKEDIVPERSVADEVEVPMPGAYMSRSASKLSSRTSPSHTSTAMRASQLALISPLIRMTARTTVTDVP